ncbi:MAG: hypothetical protein FWG79_03380 [Bacteroidales bacterium]|nr:hypothetical protein [Bacteroidales bacterium]
MKTNLFRLIIFATAFVLVFTSCEKEYDIPEPTSSCNSESQGWGESLGTISRGSQEWEIKNDSIFQIWSDAVSASNCSKDTFSSVETQTMFNADCRSNPDQKGDLFSWCAISLFADSLCPAPWRVPTAQDFIDLDIAMGGSGENRSPANTDNFQFVTDQYLGRWGGAFGGLSEWDGSLQRQDEWARYWSSTEDNSFDAFWSGFVIYKDDAAITPKFSQSKSLGLTLRCVKDGI